MFCFAFEIEHHVLSFADHDDLRVWELCDVERLESSKIAWETVLGQQVLTYPGMERLRAKSAVRLCRFLFSVRGARTLPMHVAARRGYCDIISLMLDAGTNIEEVDENGLTCLMVAAAGGRMEAMEKLLDVGASTSAATSYGLTALHIAASNLQAGAAAKLLQHGAPPNLQDKEGKSPLHLAMLADQRRNEFTDMGYQTVAVLIRGEANTGLEDIHGKTPWHMWFALGRGDVRDCLHEAQPELKSRSLSWPTCKYVGDRDGVEDTQNVWKKNQPDSSSPAGSLLERIKRFASSDLPLASLAATILLSLEAIRSTIES